MPAYSSVFSAELFAIIVPARLYRTPEKIFRYVTERRKLMPVVPLARFERKLAQHEQTTLSGNKTRGVTDM